MSGCGPGSRGSTRRSCRRPDWSSDGGPDGPPAGDAAPRHGDRRSRSVPDHPATCRRAPCAARRSRRSSPAWTSRRSWTPAREALDARTDDADRARPPARRALAGPRRQRHGLRRAVPAAARPGPAARAVAAGRAGRRTPPPRPGWAGRWATTRASRRSSPVPRRVRSRDRGRHPDWSWLTGLRAVVERAAAGPADLPRRGRARAIRRRRRRHRRPDCRPRSGSCRSTTTSSCRTTTARGSAATDVGSSTFAWKGVGPGRRLHPAAWRVRREPAQSRR